MDKFLQNKTALVTGAASGIGKSTAMLYGQLGAKVMLSDINEELGQQAVDEMKRLARQHGLLCGPSSGAHLLAAKQVRERYPALKTIVTIFCDEGEKYLTEHFGNRSITSDVAFL